MQFIDLGAQRERLGDRLKAAIDRVVEGGRYILGPEVAEFEEKLAAYVGVRHCVACANGTDALLLPLYAAGIGPGDAVFVPSFTFAATAEVVALAKAEPVFVDVDPAHLQYRHRQPGGGDRDVRAEGRLKPRAVIPVDLFGLAADYPAIDGDCRARRSAGDRGRRAVDRRHRSAAGCAGRSAQVGATSFYPAKPLGCYGDGGAMFTNDDALAPKSSAPSPSTARARRNTTMSMSASTRGSTRCRRRS